MLEWKLYFAKTLIVSHESRDRCRIQLEAQVNTESRFRPICLGKPSRSWVQRRFSGYQITQLIVAWVATQNFGWVDASTIAGELKITSSDLRVYKNIIDWLTKRFVIFRGCGKIFCADCSENSTPLPSEQLYNPVRVCSDCFSRLHHVSPCQHAKLQLKLQDIENEPVSNSEITTCHRIITPMASTTKTLMISKDTCNNSAAISTQQKLPSSLTAVPNWNEIPYSAPEMTHREDND